MATCPNSRDPCPASSRQVSALSSHERGEPKTNPKAFTLKKPMTVTSLDSTRASAAALSDSVVAAGPVRFFSQFTMSSASLPAAPKQRQGPCETGATLRPSSEPLATGAPVSPLSESGDEAAFLCVEAVGWGQW